MPNYTERATYHAQSIRERDAGYDPERVGDELEEICFECRGLGDDTYPDGDGGEEFRCPDCWVTKRQEEDR